MSVGESDVSVVIVELLKPFQKLRCEVATDLLTQRAYATDASVYQQRPSAVAFPKSAAEIGELILFCREHQLPLIPRAAGTSLAGQVVGDGLVVDVSKYLNRIIEIDADGKWVRVEPGVIRDELNQRLNVHALCFGPETSTSNRATLGGMFGNNSCGSNSIVYGAMREQVIEVSGFLGDGSVATFGPVSSQEFAERSQNNVGSLEDRIYAWLAKEFVKQETRDEIRRGFPAEDVARRNTGYALDAILDSSAFGDSEEPLNVCKLLAGSEGTLFFVTELKLKCHELPPSATGVMCPHFNSVNDALVATQIAMQYDLFGCELIDRLVLEGAARNIEQAKNLEFIEGDPAAVLIVHVRDQENAVIRERLEAIRESIQRANLGYAFPFFFGDDTHQVWSLRKAGLGVVANVPGDAKPTTVIEDTSVSLDNQPDYVAELDACLKREFSVDCVHYGHAGAGELHLRPVLNLKTAKGRKQFRDIAEMVARLIKRYGGSLSGEHGDGRLRGEFLEQMVGKSNYSTMCDIKRLFDPDNLFNPGKIVDAPPMDSSMRFGSDAQTQTEETIFDFSLTGGLTAAAEMCSGSGDCRKTELTGGVMCPSFMATRDEVDTTRARANVLRQVMSESNGDLANRLNNNELKQVMDLCISCKGCKSECPSNVDMAKMKAEFLQAWYDTHGVPRRAKLIAGFAKTVKRLQIAPRVVNWLGSNWIAGAAIRKVAGIHSKRSLPPLASRTLRQWFKHHAVHAKAGSRGHVRFFCDEFTNNLDVDVGIAAVEVLERIGYSVEFPEHDESGRVALSKGLLREAREIARHNIGRLAESDSPLVGVEPSAILTLRDEYLDLLRGDLQAKARRLAQQTMLIDELIDRIRSEDHSLSTLFIETPRLIRLHGHCHQKAVASLAPTVRMLQLPKNYRVRLIPSGCCGMAGSFGFEKEHYEVSMQIGELVLFPTIRNEPETSVIAASGTSCRHQIWDGTKQRALHPIEILRAAMRD